MKNIKYFFIFILFFLIQGIGYSITLEDIKQPKESFYRLGTTDSPEKKSDYSVEPIAEPIIKTVKTVENQQENVTYADLSIKKMSMEIAGYLATDYNDMQSDLSLLWQGAANNSDTIKFAIYKLSNPDKDKPDTNAVKKVLSTIAGMSTFIGAGMGNPVVASAALIGGNTLGIMSTDTKALNYKYTQVTDADMIILVRKVEDLQQKVVDLYYDYLTARALYNLTAEKTKKYFKTYQMAQNQKREIVLITDTFYRSALDEEQKAKGYYFEKRSSLEQLVGNDIFNQFESALEKRLEK